MAKEKKERFKAQLWIDAEIYEKAKKILAVKGQTPGEFLEGKLRELIKNTKPEELLQHLS